MPPQEIRKVVFIGGGTMGSFNSLVAALAGYSVWVYDESAEALDTLTERHRAWGDILGERWGVPKDRIEEGLLRIRKTLDPVEAAAEADLISESVFERLELKRQVHRFFDEICPPKTILTTNTSTLLVSEIAAAVKRADRFAAMHFHQPSILADLMAGPRTSPETMEALKQYLKSIGMTYVIVKKERAGYLHNAMYTAFLGAALMLHILGGISIEEIDRSWMISQNATAGPFAHLDHVGFNVVVDAFSERSDPEDPLIPIRDAVKAFFAPYLERGEWGAKSGKGFYTYPNPAFQGPAFLENRVVNPLVPQTLLNTVQATALELLVEGVGDVRDIDRSWMIPHGTAVGPLGMIDEKGLDVFLKELEERADRDPLFAPKFPSLADYLKGKIEKGELGVKSGKGFYTYPEPAYLHPDFFFSTE
jgi:enoyl-CoA hydratase/3-hydroxyacyl-CoA dehydrogenase